MWHYPPGWLPASALATPTPALLVTVAQTDPWETYVRSLSLCSPSPKPRPLKSLEAEALTMAYKALEDPASHDLSDSQPTTFLLSLRPNWPPAAPHTNLDAAARACPAAQGPLPSEIHVAHSVTSSRPPQLSPQGLTSHFFVHFFPQHLWLSGILYILPIFYWLSSSLKDKSRRTQIFLDSDLFTVTSLVHREAPSIWWAFNLAEWKNALNTATIAPLNF